MLASLADHLWQSLLFCALAALLTPCARAELAVVRPWLCRACLIKFAVPCALLYAAGQWMGFPVAQAGETVPPALAQAAQSWKPWFSPLQSVALPSASAALCLLVLMLASLACARAALLALRHRAEPPSAIPEPASQNARRVRFALLLLSSALISSCAIAVVTLPLLGGAIANRLWRHQLLLDNVRALRDAPVSMNTAAPGMGERLRIVVEPQRVLIRNIDLQELIGISNGVSPYAVFTNQMHASLGDDPVHEWMFEPRYDLELRAPIREPGEFDPYALRQRVTRLLVERFGLEIHVNGECQPPCGRWDKRRDERPL